MNAFLSLDPVSEAPPFELSRVRAISIDLDDTLWPIAPTIARAEAALLAWFAEFAPAAASFAADTAQLREARHYLQITQPGLATDLSALRREAIRFLLLKSGEDPTLAEAGFEVFFAERQRVELYADALPALQWLAKRYPVVALSNGNADVQRIGLGAHFHAALSARDFGAAKPDPRIFHRAAALAGVPAAQVLHIGDDAQLDVLGGLGAGLQVAWLNREGLPWVHGPLGPQLSAPDLLQLCEQLS